MKAVLRLLGLMCALGVLSSAFYQVRLEEFTDTVIESFNVYFVAAFGSWVTALVFEAYRWQVMVSRQQSVSLFSALRLDALNRLTNLVFPLRAGEAVRVLSARKQTGLDAPYLVATIFNERILNLVLLVFIALGLTWTVSELRDFRLPATALSALCLFGFWLLQKSHSKELSASQIAGTELTSRLQRHWYNFRRGARIMREPAVLVRVALGSTASWCCIWLALRTLLLNHNPDEPALAAWTVWLMINVATIVPVTPSNIGPFQWACILALSFFGVGQTEALAFSTVLLVIRALASAFVGGIGILGSLIWRVRPCDLKKSLLFCSQR